MILIGFSGYLLFCQQVRQHIWCRDGSSVFIAVVNTVITTLALAIIGFTQLPSLAIMIFILSLVPVAGVIISCIPLSFIAYSQGGLNDVIYILALITIVHLFESYVLNPKFMSSKTELPIFIRLSFY